MKYSNRMRPRAFSLDFNRSYADTWGHGILKTILQKEKWLDKVYELKEQSMWSVDSQQVEDCQALH